MSECPVEAPSSGPWPTNIPTTPPPINIPYTHSKDINKNNYMQLGTSLIIISIVAFLFIITYFKTRQEMWFPITTPFWITIYCLIVVTLVTGITLISIEKTIDNRKEESDKRSAEGIAFSIMYMLVFTIGTGVLIGQRLGNIEVASYFIFIMGGIAVTTWGLYNSLNIFDYEEKGAFIAGVILLVYSGCILVAVGLYAIINGVMLYTLMGVSVGFTFLLGMGLLIWAWIVGYKPETEYVPVATDPIFPLDFECNNIFATETKDIDWNSHDQIRMRFTVMLGNLYYENNKFITQDIFSLTNDTNTVWNIKYKDDKTITIDYYNQDNSLNTSLSIPITPDCSDNTFTLNITISGYDDVDNKVGTIVMFTDNNSQHTSTFVKDMYTPNEWGKNTTLTVHKNQENDLLLVQGIQMCQIPNKYKFSNIPPGYQAAVIILLSLIVLFILGIAVAPKFRNAFFGSTSSSSLTDYYKQTIN